MQAKATTGQDSLYTASAPMMLGALSEPPQQPLSKFKDAPSASTQQPPPRMIKKSVVRVEGTSRGATYMLFIRLELPASIKTTQTIPLIPDGQVRLRSAVVYAARQKYLEYQESPTQDPSNGFRKAAAALGMKVGNNPDAITLDLAASTPEVKARIAKHHAQIALVQPPFSAPIAGKQIRIVVLHLEAALTAMPPSWPYIVEFPVPRCLNNRLHFDLEQEEKGGKAFADGVVVEVDPPLVPGTRSEVSEEGEGDSADAMVVSGPFPSTEKMIIRWASASAAASPASMAGIHPLRGANLNLQSELRFIGTDDEGARAIMSISTKAGLEGLHYPGLDPSGYVGLSLLTSQMEARWIQSSIEVASTDSTTLRKWALALDEETGLDRHARESRSRSTSLSSAASIPATSSSVNSDSVDGDTTGDEEVDLVDTRPPKALSDPDIDFSFSFERGAHESDHPRPAPRGRRHSIGIRSRTPRASLSDLPKDEPEGIAPQSTIFLLIDIASLTRRADRTTDFTFEIEGHFSLPCRRVADSYVVELPQLVGRGLRTASVFSLSSSQLDIQHLPTTIQSVELQEGCEGYSLTLSAEQDARNVDYMRVAFHPPFAEHLQLEDADASVVTNATARPSLRALGSVNASVSPPETKSAGYASKLVASSPDGEPDTSRGAINRRSRDEDRSLLTSPFGSDTSNDLEFGLSPPASDPLLDSATSEDRSADMWTSTISEASVEVWCSDEIAADVVRTLKRTVHRLVMSWPRSPPRSGLVHGSLLPRLVIALPRSSMSTVHILHASVDGIGLDAQSQSSPSKEAASHIVDLELPRDTQQSARPKVTLLYHIDSSPERAAEARHCIAPPVACSIAQLQITIYDCPMLPTLSFTEKPFSWAISHKEEANHRVSSATAFMLPAMSSSSMTLTPAAMVSLNATVNLNGAKRRRDSNAEQRPSSSGPRKISSILSIVHVLWTLLLTLILLGTVANITPAVQDLARKVDSLAVAVDVDFREGTWRPEDSSGIGRDHTFEDEMSSIIYDRESSDTATRRFFSTNQASSLPSNSDKAAAAAGKELSHETTSFLQLLRAISANFTRHVAAGFVWPFQLLARLAGA